jgi:hypothetical protein
LTQPKNQKKIKKEKKKFSARLRFATDVQRRMERSRINFSAIKICTCPRHSSIQCLVVSQILECSDWIILRLCLQNLQHNLLEVSVWFSMREGQIFSNQIRLCSTGTVVLRITWISMYIHTYCVDLVECVSKKSSRPTFNLTDSWGYLAYMYNFFNTEILYTCILYTGYWCSLVLPTGTRYNSAT